MAMANELPPVEGAAHPATATGTTQLLERTVLLLLFAGLLLGILAVLLPFTTAILFGASVAIAGWPLRDFLLRCGLKRGLTATLLLLLALALIALPLMAVAPSLAEHLTKGADRLRDYVASAPQVPSWLVGLPMVGARLFASTRMIWPAFWAPRNSRTRWRCARVCRASPPVSPGRQSAAISCSSRRRGFRAAAD